MIVRLFALTLFVAAVGCSAATPRAEYPRYYGRWAHLGTKDRDGLDSARSAASASSNDVRAILLYARASTQLARAEAKRWFDVHDRQARTESARRLRVTTARTRVLQSCHHATALYREVQMKGARLAASDRLNLVWLHLFTDRELEAEALLDSLIEEDSLSAATLDVLARLRAELSQELDQTDLDE